MLAFQGRRFMSGRGLGGVFRNIFRTAMPYLKKGASYLAGQLFNTGGKVLRDVGQGANLKKALRKRAVQTKNRILKHTGAKVKRVLLGRGGCAASRLALLKGRGRKRKKKSCKKTCRKKARKTKKQKTTNKKSRQIMNALF
jgi:hypothetical protein